MPHRPYAAPAAELYSDLQAVNSHYRASARQAYRKSLTGLILAGLTLVVLIALA